jgi:mono/diheme cytochrome c family protein
VSLRAPALAALLALAGCEYYQVPAFSEDQVLGGERVPAVVLSRGARAYMQACRPCHGAAGDGKGPQAVGMDPPPRDLRLGVMAYASVPSGALWLDEDLVRVVRGGLAGTGMRAWTDVSDEDLAAIVQFVKTLSPRFRDEVPGPPLEVTPDPWAGRPEEAVRRGRAVYHGVARCHACHPAEASDAELAAYARDAGVPPVDRPWPRLPALVPSDFGRPLLATDLARGPLRAVRPATRARDLYRAIAAGVGGTGMPSWKGALPEEDLWALVHYVDRLRGAPPAR